MVNEYLVDLICNDVYIWGKVQFIGGYFFFMISNFILRESYILMETDD